MANTLTNEMDSDTDKSGFDCDSLSILSYNSCGFNNQKSYTLLELSKQSDIIFLQEHWFQNSHLQKLDNAITDFDVSAKSGMDTMRDVHHGRGYGGVAIFWNKSLGKNVVPIRNESSRIICIQLKLKNTQILMVNCYFPYDTGSHTEVHDDIYGMLAEISSLCQNNENIVIGGDINCDFNRNTFHVNLVKQFLYENNLTLAENLASRVISYDARGTTSCIDHFFISKNIVNLFKGFKNINCGHNLSDHIPVQLTMYNLSVCRSTIHENIFTQGMRTNWDCSPDIINNYTNVLRDNSDAINIPIDAAACIDVNCSCINHKMALDSYFTDIIKAIYISQRILPKYNDSSNSKSQLHGWNQLVKPARDESLYWHHVWIQHDKPNTGYIANCMRISRAEYHKRCRDVKRNQQNLSKLTFLDKKYATTKDFWKKLGKCFGKSKQVASVINGSSNHTNISNQFQTSFKNLYSRGPLDNTNNIGVTISRSVESYSLHNDVITPESVRTAISCIKPDKWDGSEDNLSTNNFIHAPNNFLVHISIFLNSCVIHGYCPNQIHISTIIPIFKTGKIDKSSLDNYRGITIGSIIFKILDWVILNYYRTALHTSDLQFGFKPGHSTDTCTWLLKETVGYYNRNGSNVYACFLDCSKAFDMVDHDKLFEKLHKRKLPNIFLRFLYYTYSQQKARVKWQSTYSSVFKVINGVKQGGVLSPVLYAVYINELLNEFQKDGIGCWIGRRYVGALCYADDLSLLCPSLKGLQKMLNRSSEYAEAHGLSFNASKTMAISFKHKSSKHINQPGNIFLNNNKINWVEKVKHLGHWISHDNSDDLEYNRIIGHFYSSFNSLHAALSFAHPSTLSRLMVTYCTSYFGLVTCNMHSPRLSNLVVAWNKAVRKIWKLPYKCHTRFLPQIFNTSHIKSQLFIRFLKFTYSCLNSANSLVSSLSLFFAHDNTSLLGYNFGSVCRMANISAVTFYSNISIKNISFNNIQSALDAYLIPQEDSWRISIILDLLDIKHNDATLDLFNSDECDILLDYVCCY